MDIAESVGANEVILWNADSRDWEHPQKDKIVENVLSQIKRSGGVALFHDIHPDVLDSLPEILKSLEEEKYKFVTVDELLKTKYGK